MQSYNGMKIGDLITTCHKGFFILNEIEEREPYTTFGSTKLHTPNPLFRYSRVGDDKGRPCGGKPKSCDASYCNLATDSIETMIKDHMNTVKQMKALVKTHT